MRLHVMTTLVVAAIAAAVTGLMFALVLLPTAVLWWCILVVGGCSLLGMILTPVYVGVYSYLDDRQRLRAHTRRNRT